jgi:alpha-tubulin suppressor-like RCC1 family protein
MCAVIGSQNFEATVKGNDPAKIYCWGEGFNSLEPGEMRNQSYAPTTDPVLLHTTGDLDSISVGYRYVCILEHHVTLRCWGDVPRHGQHDRGIALINDPTMDVVLAMKSGPRVRHHRDDDWSNP